MTVRRSLLVQGLLLGASALLSAVYAARLPDTVVTHWNIHGQPDGWGGKWTILLMMPIVQASMALLTVALPLITPRDRRPGPIQGWIMALIAAMMAAIHVVLVLKTAGAAFDPGRVLLGVLFAFWMPLGNVMGKVRPNRYMGIRVPWTLSDDRVWHTAHRAAGRLWAYGGALGLLLCLVGTPMPILVAYLVVLSLAPLPQSWAISRSLGLGFWPDDLTTQ